MAIATGIKSRALVPEALIVYMLKHCSAFDWACMNCRCRDEYVSNHRCPASTGPKWQRSQGETGVDMIARIRPENSWFGNSFPAGTNYIVLEAKGDRARGDSQSINRPAYNEMTGSLCAFLVSNIDRIAAQRDHLFGWIFPRTFVNRTIEAFQNARRNLPKILPRDRAFLVGEFDGEGFWTIAPSDLAALADQWFRGTESMRNQILKESLGAPHPQVHDALLRRLFKFEVIRRQQD